MIETARRFLAQKTGSVGVWIALVALGLLAAWPLASGQTTGFITFLTAVLLASGIVSRDASSGALQMILTRPIRRGDYILGRYLGYIALLTGFLVGTLVLATLVYRLDLLIGGNTGTQGFDWAEVLRVLVQELARGALIGATLLFFSTFLRGVGDFLAYLLIALIFNLVPQIAAGIMHRPELAEIRTFLVSNFAPQGAWADILRGGRFFQIPTGQYILALAGYLLVATLIFNRREFSYGTD